MVWYKPWSNGSGIPETKCVLNGVSIPQVSDAAAIDPSIVRMEWDVHPSSQRSSFETCNATWYDRSPPFVPTLST